MKNPFGWKPYAKDPFPLARPTRPTTPCLVAAFRLDGAPVDAAEFHERFNGVPADLGEVVDFDVFIDTDFRTAAALAADGTVRFLDQEADAAITDRRLDAVEIRCGREIAIALRRDGSAAVLPANGKSIPGPGLDFSTVETWRQLVAVRAGGAHVIGLQADGVPLAAGQNEKGQAAFPEKYRADLVEIEAGEDSSWAVRSDRNDLRIHRFGAAGGDAVVPIDQRFFLSVHWYRTDRAGHLEGSSCDDDIPVSHHKLDRAPSHDISDIEVVQISGPPANLGVAAAREGEDRWHFWGDLGDICELNTGYCALQAAGAWKVFPAPPYALVLKPVDRLESSDWTGADFP